MPANVVQLSETNGTIAAAVRTDGIANVNFGSFDTPNLVTANHKIIQGTVSFAKWIQFELVTNNNTSDGNFRFWKSAGAYVTGEVIGWNNAGTSGNPTNYITTYGHSSAGGGAISPMPYNGNGTALNIVGVWGTVPLDTSLPNHNFGIGGNLSAVLTANGTYTDFIVTALSTTLSTPAGAVNTKTFTITYDEV